MREGRTFEEIHLSNLTLLGARAPGRVRLSSGRTRIGYSHPNPGPPFRMLSRRARGLRKPGTDRAGGLSSPGRRAPWPGMLRVTLAGAALKFDWPPVAATSCWGPLRPGPGPGPGPPRARPPPGREGERVSLPKPGMYLWPEGLTQRAKRMFGWSICVFRQWSNCV